MKTKQSICLAAIAAFTGSAFAGTPVKAVAPTETEFYRAGEFQGSVSFLGGARTSGGGGGQIAAGQNTPGQNTSGQNASVPLGGGPQPAWTSSTAAGVDAELKYFITRNFGIGLEGEWLNTSRTLYGSALNLYLRAPLSASSRWAPYLFAGAGGLYGGGAYFEGHIGGGIEYRITPKIGIFGDARYEWVDATRNNIPQFGAMRFGVNVVF
jgi:hypothetical protein